MATWTTTPKDWANGSVVTDTDLDTHLRDFANGWGPKTSYTPTLAGFTLGNGTVSGSYTQIQKTVWFEATFVFGSTSAAASAVPTLTLPVTAASSAVNNALIRAQFIDSGTAAYLAAGRLLTTTTVAAYIIGASGILTTPSTTTPHTWATNDGIYVAGIYEAA